MNKRFFLYIFICAGIIGAIYTASSFRTKGTFAPEIKKCNLLETKVRFSCYRSVLEQYYHGDAAHIKDWVKTENPSFESADTSYAIFGTNCHTFYHAVGDFIAEKGKDSDIGTLINYCPNTCTSACMMGLYKRTALIHDFAIDVLERYYSLCPKGSEHSCAHEIGHNLHDKYVTPILKVLDEMTHTRFSWNPAMDYNYNIAKEANLVAPFEDCKKLVPESELAYCYSGIGHNLFLFSEFSKGGYKTFFDECEKSAGTHRNDCYDFLIYRIGINDAGVKFLTKNFEEGKRICDEVSVAAGRQETKHHCYLGIGGGIGLFLDSEYANHEITTANIEVMQKNVLKHIKLCEGSEKDFALDCYRGILGTGTKKLYKDLNLYDAIIENILPQIKNNFQVVG